MKIVEYGALLPKNAALNIRSPQGDFSSPLYKSMHRTIEPKVLPPNTPGHPKLLRHSHLEAQVSERIVES